MHIIRTFILRLLVDSDEPGVLRGSVQPVPEGEAQPFADEEALLAALDQMIRQVTEVGGVEPSKER